MKNWFQARNRREQLLLTTFVLAGAVIWLLGATGRLRAGWTGLRSTRTELAAQQLWIDRKQAIETAAGAAVRNLDPARTYDATKLVSTVTTLASGAGLTPSIEPPVTQRTAQFAYHTIKVTLRRATLNSLLGFYDEMAKQAPYLNLEQIAMQTERTAPGQLNVTLQISATQIARPGG